MWDELRQTEHVGATCGSDRQSGGWSTLLIRTQDDQRMWQDATSSDVSLRHICYPLLQLCMAKPSPSRRQKYGPSALCNHQHRVPRRGPGKAGDNNVLDHGQACEPDRMRRKSVSSTYGARQYRTSGRHKQQHCGAPGKNSWCMRKRAGKCQRNKQHKQHSSLGLCRYYFSCAHHRGTSSHGSSFGSCPCHATSLQNMEHGERFGTYAKETGP